MTSPRGIRSIWKHTLIIAALLAGRAGSVLHAQEIIPPNNSRPGNPAPSTNVDSAARRADTAAAPGSATASPEQGATRPDSLAPDTLRPDTLRPDATAPGSASGAAAPDTTPPRAPEPVDSVLAAACRASGGEPPDLLTVMFRPTATEAERQQAARDVGGVLLEQSRHQAPGAWYVQAPGSGINPLVADRLIRLPPVLEVGSTRCPS
jgi:hypothetical protein